MIFVLHHVQLEQSKDDQLKAALRDAYLLLRSRGSEGMSCHILTVLSWFCALRI